MQTISYITYITTDNKDNGTALEFLEYLSIDWYTIHNWYSFIK
jgi:hypothetical protein